MRKRKSTMQVPKSAFFARATIKPDSIDQEKRTVIFVASTGFKDIRQPWDGDPYYEELEISEKAIRFDRFGSGNAPFLSVHNSYDLSSVIGVIERAWIEGKELLCEVRFSKREDADVIFKDVIDGILPNVSVGYRVYTWQKTQAKGDEIATYRAIDWEPYELSLVPIGFDPKASVRANEKTEMFSVDVVEDERATAHNHEDNTMNLDQRAAAVGLKRNDGESDAALEARVIAAENAARASATATQTQQQSSGVSQADVDAAVSRGIAGERTRSETIRREVRAARLEDTFADELIGSGATIDVARAKIIDKMASVQESSQSSTVSNIRTGTDHSKVIEIRTAVVDSIRHRYNPGVKLENNMSRHFVPMSLSRLAEECLVIAGINVSGMSKREMVGRAITTTDLPNILADVMNKELRQGYMEPKRRFVGVFRQTTAVDFKPKNLAILSAAPVLETKNEEGEYRYGTLTDKGVTYHLITVGKRLRITREVLINDDLDALTRIPQMFGAAAARYESATVWACLTGNPSMYDSVVLFHADHGNITSTGSINATNVGALRAKMRKQTGLAGEIIDVEPQFIICGPDKELELDQYFGAFVPAQQSNVTPSNLRSLTPVVVPNITGNNWYLASSPNSIDTIEYCYLEGENGVYTEMMERFDTDGIEIKARLDFGAKAVDWRGLQLCGS